MKRKLFFLTLLLFIGVNGFTQTVANQPPDIIQCGWEVFNLTQQNDIILAGQSNEDFVINYYLSQDDAELNMNVIANTTQYVAENNNQTIYARVSSNLDESFAVTSFQIIWFSWENIDTNPPSPINACDDDDDGVVILDLTSVIDEVVEDPSAYSITFHYIEMDVVTGDNPIENPEAFSTDQMGDWPEIWIRVENPETGCYVIHSIPFYIEPCTDNLISGILTLDTGENGCESGSTPAAHVMISLTNGDILRYTYTNVDGEYTFYNVPDGVNEIIVMGQGTQTFQTVPASYTVTTPGVIEDNNFCLTAPDPYNDALVYILPYQLPRPGFPFQCKLLLQNLGNTTLNGAVTLQFDDTIMTYDNSSPMMNLTGNTLDVYYTNLQPFVPQYIEINFTVFTPPTVNAGDILNLVANITVTEGDDNILNNTQINSLEVVNSWDPNDIACREGDYITEEQADDYLHYLIRFQNTGNADAINVRIEDVLDDKLDWGTLQPLSASHDYRVEAENNTVQFIFNDINLPGEEVNEPESHGYIAYRIKPKAGAEIGDIFEATASIYFDFNEAIITNTATTEIQSIMGLEDNILNQFSLYPNPAKNIVHIAFEDSVANNVSISISDISGKIVLAKTISNGENSFDVSGLTTGMYFVSLTSDGKKQTKKLMIE
ncbi:T9SS type A sorting domain-containing protein [Flavobacterium rakeshii]|uniref:DUF7619 domain-containing protein n=1 Tax=Flavobacterium rakeshii TaxID=1038845 RepID=UPI002E7BB877|nr:T9SS type A sorting domain-containing protein [Flavobacterium rakeshii]MEE1898314.1 T9SS type A sorting domain-containing protein [Flavobacterium rakeshii]